MFLIWLRWFRFAVVCLFCLYSSFVLSKGSEVRILLNGTPQFQYAGYYVAQAKGFYHDAGVSVEITNKALPQVDLINAVVEGRAEFSVGNSSLALFALQGKPIVVLSNIFQRSSGVMIVKPDFGNQIFNVSNQKIILPTPVEAPEIFAFLTSQGVVFPDVVKGGEGASSISEFTSNKISAFFGQIYGEPLALEAGKVPFNIIDPVNYGVHFYGDTLFANRDWADQNIGLTKSFVAATLKGWAYAFAHRTEAAEIIRTHFSGASAIPTLEKEAQVIYELAMPEKIGLGRVDPVRWHLIGDFFKGVNLVNPNVKLPSTFFISDWEDSDQKQLNFFIWASLAFVLIFLAIISYFVFAKFNVFKKSAYEQQILVDEARSIANHDPLTNLPNRRLLIQRLREAVNFFEKTKESFALCFLDIDDFKKINDRFGHIVGDDILVQLAIRLQYLLNPADTLARQGGDEFVILIYNVDSSSQILEKIDELKRVVQEPLMSHGETFMISASFGYSIYMIDSNTIEDLLKVADRRMYREKFRTLERAK